MDASDLLLHVRFNAWASRRAMEAASALSGEELSRDMRASHVSVLGTLAHIFVADRIWLSRIEGQPRTTLTDPGEVLAWEALERLWPPLLGRYAAWAETADWNRTVSYTTTEGRPDEMLVRRIILHLVNHDSFHRGQVVAFLRQLGRVPPALDLIAYYRSLSRSAATE